MGTLRLRPIWLIIGAALIWRGLLGAIAPLGTDEAYALAVGRDFSASFFDHPPLGFWAPALMEALGARSELLLRVPNLALGALSMWFLYLSGRLVGGEVAGLWTAGLAGLAPFINVSGVMILPDGPLSAGLAITIYAALRLIQGEDKNLAVWGWGGLGLGVALASKYQAGLAGIAILLWLATSPAYWVWFRRPGFYLAVVLALAGILPVIIWNSSHAWISLAFHSGRAGGGMNLRNFAFMGIAQALYLSPLIFFFALRLIMTSPFWREAQTRLLLFLALVPILAFNTIYLFSRNSLPHWAMPGYLALLPLLGLMLSNGVSQRMRHWMLGLALGLNLVIGVVGLHARTGVLTAHLSEIPHWDKTDPLLPLSKTRSALLSSGFLQNVTYLAAADWIPAGHISAAMGPEWPMVILGSRPNHFQFMAENQFSAGLLLGIGGPGQQEHEIEQLIALAKSAGYQPELLGFIPVERGARAYFNLSVILLPAR